MDVIIIKVNCVRNRLPIVKERSVAISGITPGERDTPGCTVIKLHGFPCKVQVVSDNFPIETDRLRYNFFTRHNGKVNAAGKCLEIRYIKIPFTHNERFTMSPHSRQVIFARVKNEEQEVGYVPLQDIGPDLLFGNFVANTNQGKVYALCISVSEKAVEIEAPEVTLEPCEEIRTINDRSEDKETANILRAKLEDKDRVTNIFEQIVPDTLKDLRTRR